MPEILVQRVHCYGDFVQLGLRIEQEVQKYHVPPPTVTIPLTTQIATIVRGPLNRPLPTRIHARWGDLLRPKIITALGTDGLKYKQLFKRRQRRPSPRCHNGASLRCRLLPPRDPTSQPANGLSRSALTKSFHLTATTLGLLNSSRTPFHVTRLSPPLAHQRHYPRDLKPNVCRKYIEDVQSSSC